VVVVKKGDRVVRVCGYGRGDRGRVLEPGEAPVVKLDDDRTVSAPASHWAPDTSTPAPPPETTSPPVVASAVRVRTVLSDLFGGAAKVRGVR
jgi:hypothetical protein